MSPKKYYKVVGMFPPFLCYTKKNVATLNETTQDIWKENVGKRNFDSTRQRGN
jgi:hypothetical protein